MKAPTPRSWHSKSKVIFVKSSTSLESSLGQAETPLPTWNLTSQFDIGTPTSVFSEPDAWVYHWGFKSLQKVVHIDPFLSPLSPTLKPHNTNSYIPLVTNWRFIPTARTLCRDLVPQRVGGMLQVEAWRVGNFKATSFLGLSPPCHFTSRGHLEA